MIAMNREAPRLLVKEQEIKPLTSLRFFAAVLVFSVHLVGMMSLPEVLSEQILPEGRIGVGFFFVLSGFILTYKYHATFTSLGTAALRRYSVSRIARIYPVHLLTLAIAILMLNAPVHLENAVQIAIINGALLHSFVPMFDFYNSYNIPSWSLSDEIFFYALLPGFLALWPRIGATSLRKAVMAGVVVWLLPFMTVWLFRDVESANWDFYYSPYFRLFDFLMGISLGYIFLQLRGVEISARLMNWLEVSSIGVFLVAFLFSSNIHQSFRYAVYYTPFIGLIVLTFAFQKGYVSRFFSHPFLVGLGEISFSFYMLHALILQFIQLIGGFAIYPVLATITAFGLTLGLSFVCYRFFESPMREKIRELFSASRMPQAASHPSPANPARDSKPNDSRWVMPEHFVACSAFAVIAVVLATYVPSLRLGFLRETWGPIEWAGRLPISQYLTGVVDPRVPSNGLQPIANALLLGEYLGFHFDATGYYFVRLVAHVANVLLFFSLVWKISRRLNLSLITVLIYSGLPVYTQAVFGLAEMQPEATLPWLLCIWLWVSFLQSGKIRYYLLASVTFVIALLTKETNITLLLTLLLVDCLLIRRKTEFVQFLRQYVLLFALLFGYLVMNFLAQGETISAYLSGYNLGAQALFSPMTYFVILPALRFDTSPIHFVAAGIAITLWFLVTIRSRNKVLAFIGLEAIVLCAPDPMQPLLLFAPRYLYSAAMLVAVVVALILQRVRLAFRPSRWGMGFAAAVVTLIVLANAAQVTDTAAQWSEAVRQLRVPFRDIVQEHPALPADTLLYFVDPPSIQDLRGLIFSRYGTMVSVRGSTAHAGDGYAGLQGHANSLVYYFDETGKPNEVSVDRHAVTGATPALPATFDSSIRLQGYEVTRNVLKRGDTVVLFLYWRAVRPVSLDYTVFVHLLDDKGNQVEGYDSPPSNGKSPTSRWNPEEVIVDPHVFTIEPDLAKGDYWLELGMYYNPTGERLMLQDGHSTAPSDKVRIAPFEVE